MQIQRFINGKWMVIEISNELFDKEMDDFLLKNRERNRRINLRNLNKPDRGIVTSEIDNMMQDLGPMGSVRMTHEEYKNMCTANRARVINK